MEFEEELKVTISKNLVKYRKAAKFTQLELSEKIKYSDKNISKWERGEAVPDVVVLKQLADIYGVSVDDLLSENGDVAKTNQIENGGKRPKQKLMNKKQLLITLLSISLVWLVAFIAYGALKLALADGASNYAWWVFIIAIPVSAIVLVVFTSIWCTNLLNAISVSILIWSLAVAISVCINVPYIWVIYIIAIPVQILDILWFIFRKVNKNLKQKNQKVS